jgi:hypothetical protein
MPNLLHARQRDKSFIFARLCVDERQAAAIPWLRPGGVLVNRENSVAAADCQW